MSQSVPTPAELASEALLERVRERNSVLDRFFYDVDALSPAEVARLDPWQAVEGSIIIVPPAGAGELTPCADIGEFVARGGTGVRVLAIAGVGSSALGSAAFARNVADALGQPVAAVVSGYGMSDLITEAFSGAFFFGALNQFRHLFEQFDRPVEPPRARTAAATPDAGPAAPTPRHRNDIDTVIELLTDVRFDFRLLAGHSKGNLVASEALYAIRRDHPERLRDLAKAMTVITVSASITMPGEFRKVIDVIGRLDWFGRMNSTWFGVPEVVWPGAWHDTSRRNWHHLPVEKVIRHVVELYRLTV